MINMTSHNTQDANASIVVPTTFTIDWVTVFHPTNSVYKFTYETEVPVLKNSCKANATNENMNINRYINDFLCLDLVIMNTTVFRTVLYFNMNVFDTTTTVKPVNLYSIQNGNEYLCYS